MCTSVTFTVCFDAPFWVGILEIVEADQVRATRHVFGSEPTDAELYQFLLRHGTALLERAHANPPVPAQTRRAARPNPKRAMRLAAKEAARIAQGSRSTASQEALRQELEQRKSHSAEETRQRKQAESERKYAIARAKRKERKRGR
ncbi:YjdF family protein [Streptomyces rapamycinicus]|uniref:YjdF family protein n=1 Tax=Streptomyces rhizosphaericus TaxID=114699 RepID=A0A6G4AHI5_9ACTN|nr:YjdF family protein [Streptomyces rhizosphaericus]